MTDKPLNFERWWDISAAFLLLAAVLTSGTRLVVTNWTDNLSIVQTVVFFGTLAGLALGYSRFSVRTVRFFAVCYGLFIILWQLGKSIDAETSWLEKIGLLINRIHIILTQLTQNEPVQDSLLFLITVFSIYWVLSIHAGWAFTRRGDGWLAILPSGFGLFIIQILDSTVPSKAAFLGIYIFLSLVLVARVTYLQSNKEWQARRSVLPAHISMDLIRFTISAAFLIVVLAWTIPALAKALPLANRAWRPIRTAWVEYTKEFENAFSSLRSTMYDYSSTYGSSASLGLSAAQDDTQIFVAKAPLNLPLGIRLYWRAKVYDTFEYGEWISSLINSTEFDPEDPELFAVAGDNRWKGRFTIISATKISTLFTPSQPLWVSRKGRIEYRRNPDDTIDISSFNVEPPIEFGDHYQVDAAISDSTISQLIAAGTDYPEWILERYLQLPDSVSPRTMDLAKEITAGIETPYEKANAITKYLRSNIQYVPVLDEAPPSDQDVVDWLLFDSKQGFCNYYATAEIVLLRSIGIPARYALGYAEGDLLDDTDTNFIPTEFTYIIRHRDSHAWPEVYFPGIGWIEFEPTASQSEIQRSSGEEGTPGYYTDKELAALQGNQQTTDPSIIEADQASDGYFNDWKGGISIWLLIFLGVILLMAWFWVLPMFGVLSAPRLLRTALIHLGIHVPVWLEDSADISARRKVTRIPPFPVLFEKVFIRLGRKAPEPIQRWARMTEMPTLAKYYHEINRAIIFCGGQPAPTDTPGERASELARLLPLAEEPARILVSQYQIGIYSKQDVDLRQAQESAHTIRRLANKKLLKRLLQQFKRTKRLA